MCVDVYMSDPLFLFYFQLYTEQRIAKKLFNSAKQTLSLYGKHRKFQAKLYFEEVWESWLDLVCISYINTSFEVMYISAYLRKCMTLDL